MADPQPATRTSPTPIADLGEFGLIERIQAVLGEPKDDQVVRGIGDDAAVYRVGEERVHVVTTDALIDSVHFDRAFTPMEYLGFKSISVNASDVAAMNAQPRYATVALGLPSGVPAEAVEALYEGMRKACEAYRITLVGGDLMAAHRMTHRRNRYRRGGRGGRRLPQWRAGGRPALPQRRRRRSVCRAEGAPECAQRHGRNRATGLDARSSFPYAIGRQLAPVARLDAVRAWADRGVRPSALIDVSDGVASEVHHLCARKRPGCPGLRRCPTRRRRDPSDCRTLQRGPARLRPLPAARITNSSSPSSEADLDRLEPGTFADNRADDGLRARTSCSTTPDGADAIFSRQGRLPALRPLRPDACRTSESRFHVVERSSASWTAPRRSARVNGLAT